MSKMTRTALPMLVANWIFGMGIIEYPPGNEYRRLSFLYSSICLLSYYCIAAYSYSQFLSMRKELETSLGVIKFAFYSHLFLTTGAIVSGWKRSQGIRLIILRIRNVDLLFEKIGVVVKYSRRFKVQIAVYISRMLFFLIFLIINSYSLLAKETVKNTEIAAIVALSYPTVLMFIVDITFVNVVICAFQQFHKLNDTLKKMLTSSEDWPQHKRVITVYLQSNISQINQINSLEADVTYTLDIAKKVHLELVHLCKGADETFGLHILQSIIVSIGVTTGCLYHIYELLPCTKIVGFNFNRVLLHNCTWILYYILKIFIFCKGCSIVEEEAIKTGDVISEFYDEPSSTEETKTVIREFHNYLIRNVISFSAYGFIKIDLKLINVILGSVTTYLMIFSQFGNAILPDFVCI